MNNLKKIELTKKIMWFSLASRSSNPIITACVVITEFLYSPLKIILKLYNRD